MRNLNLNGESGSEPYTPTGQSVSGDGSYSPDFRGDFGAGLLDLHAMDDTELLSEHIISEPFEPSPLMPGSTAAYDNDNNEDPYTINTRNQRGQGSSDVAAEVMVVGKETSSKENNVAKLRVVGQRTSLNGKILQFETTARLKLSELFRDQGEVSQYLAKSVFLINIGGNDYLNNYLMPDRYESSRIYSPEAFADLLMNTLTTQILNYNCDLFLFLYAILIIVSAMTSLKKHQDKSTFSGKAILYLNRHQIEEWKGWMQARTIYSGFALCIYFP